jgi:hypothetical protein
LTSLLLRRAFLVYVGLEDLLTGLGLLVWPEELFRLLKVEPRDLVLYHALALLILARIPCLALAAWRPRDWRHLVLVPIIGRLLLAGMWTWLLCSDRVILPQPALYGLLAFALIWLPGLVWTLRPCSDQPACE